MQASQDSSQKIGRHINSQLRILLVHWGSTGAGPDMTASLADELSALPGVEVAVSASSLADKLPTSPSVHVMTLRTYRSSAGLLLGLPRAFIAAFKLRRFIACNKVDVVFSPMLSVWQSLIAHPLIPKHTRRLFAIHDATEHPGDEHPILKLARMADIRHASTVVAFSEYSKTQLLRQFSGRHIGKTIYVSRLGIASRVPRTIAAASKTRIVVGFFGRLSTYKGVDLFLEAVATLLEEGRPIAAHVWGSGTLDETTTALVAKLSGRVTLHNHWVGNEDVPEVLGSFDILVLPYREASQSGVLMLAAEFGIPSVVTPVGGLVEQAGMLGGSIVAADVSAPAVADALRTLILNASVRQGLGRAAHARAQAQYGWSSIASDLVQWIQEN